ncbi:hypothetical protein BDB01DRAFT_850285 [Pilobolus umbonatus]|nr:hypothetical protein BDB01DRAFT_850285 [Pilobolus umbonatus]
MTKRSNPFLLWAPPTFDLSLDSFSTDILKQFEKDTYNMKRDTPEEVESVKDNMSTLSNSNYSTQPNDNIPETDHESIVPQSDTSNRSSGIITSAPVPSVVMPTEKDRSTEIAVPAVEESIPEEPVLERVPTLQKMPSHEHKESIDETVSIPENLNRTVSRSYPPKPLQYTPVNEPTSPAHSHSVMSVPSMKQDSSDKKRGSSVHSKHTIPTPKKRSFFSLRFC